MTNTTRSWLRRLRKIAGHSSLRRKQFASQAAIEHLEDRTLLAAQLLGVLTPGAVLPNSPVSVNISADPAGLTSGIEVRLFYDSDQLIFNTLSGTNIEANPLLSVTPKADATNADGNANTDMFIDVSLLNSTLAPDLLSALFTTTSNFTGTDLNLTGVTGILDPLVPDVPITAEPITVNLGTASPALTLGGLTIAPDSLNEGGMATLSGSFSADAGSGAHQVTIDWGDGTVPTVLNLAAGVSTFSAPHLFADNAQGGGDFTITATVLDPATLTVDVGTTTVSVLNVAPSVTKFTAPDLSVTGVTVNFSAKVTDPGLKDLVSATIDFGDGTAPVQATILNGTITASHVYTKSGDFKVKLTVVDDDLGQAVVNTNVTVLPSDDGQTPEPGVTKIGNTLYVVGTESKDKIKIRQKHGQILVKIRGGESVNSATNASGITDIVVITKGGGDRVKVKKNVGIKTQIDPPIV